MTKLCCLAATSMFLAIGALSGQALAGRYLWQEGGAATTARTLAEAAPPPPGFRRIEARQGSFADWLRGLPLKPDGAPVRLYDGRAKWNQTAHIAVIDIDTGKENLQQCADAIMRLRAEYLLASGRTGDIAFNNTNGKRMVYRGKSYAEFRRYMRQIFAYAGTYSLEREMVRVSPADMRIGDVFIQGGFPGHAVLVIDMAENQAGEKRFLLLQSFMPAQDMHVLVNPHGGGSPWYPLNFGRELVTPEWIFKAENLRRFKGE